MAIRLWGPPNECADASPIGGNGGDGGNGDHEDLGGNGGGDGWQE